MAIYAQETLLPATTVSNVLPVNVKDEDLYLFEHDLSKSLSAIQLFHFRNLGVTPYGILFNGLHVYKQFLIWPKHSREFNSLYLLRNYLKRKKKITDKNITYVVCFDYWSMGYFHWLCDFLPRLLLMQKELEHATLLLPENHNYTYIKEGLEVLGIKNVLWFSMDQYVRCAKALVPGYTSISGDHHPALMKQLQRKFLDHYAPEKSSGFENIYVSRAKAKGRFIRNEAALIVLLEQYGFKTVFFEEHTFAEQVSLANNCKNLVGLHGANLGNLLFMQPRSSVLELRIQGDDKRNYYFSLASTCSLNYFYLQCNAIINNNAEMPDVEVDLQALKIQVERMLAYTKK